MKLSLFLKLSALPAAVLLGGCATADLMLSGESGYTATLAQATDASHKAAISALDKMNEIDQQFRIQDGVRASSFSKADLSALAPEDIAAWDKILSGLDAYCAALSALSSGKQSTDFTNAAESFGSDMQSLAKATKVTPGSYAADAETAVTAIGGIVINIKADDDIQKVAREADPQFRSIINDLISALGFEGNPPKPAAHGILATYQDHYNSYEAPFAKAFKGDAIANFAGMSPEQKKAAIDSFVAWLNTRQDHDTFVASVGSLVVALNKTAVAHQALADGSKPTLSTAFSQLQAEIKNVQGIYQKFKKG